MKPAKARTRYLKNERDGLDKRPVKRINKSETNTDLRDTRVKNMTNLKRVPGSNVGSHELTETGSKTTKEEDDVLFIDLQNRNISYEDGDEPGSSVLGMQKNTHGLLRV